MKLSFFFLEKVCDKQSKQWDNYCSYSRGPLHTHLHANQLNKDFKASVGTMNCGCVMS